MREHNLSPDEKKIKIGSYKEKNQNQNDTMHNYDKTVTTVGENYNNTNNNNKIATTTPMFKKNIKEKRKTKRKQGVKNK